MKRKAKDILIEMEMQELRKKHPSFPPNRIPKISYRDNNANDAERMIVKCITLHGGIAERRSNTGRYLPGKTTIDTIGRARITKGKYIPGTGRNGTADVSGVFKGVPLAIEIKIGRDRQSEAQKQYQRDFENAGGWYYIAKDFESFYRDFTKRFEIKKPSAN